MIAAKCQMRSNAPWITVQFVALPRVDEYVIVKEDKFRVCQVQYRLSKDGTYHFVPYLILQQEKR